MVFIPIFLLIIRHLKHQTHKHLGLTLDEKLSFTNCINDKINKTLKRVVLLHKLSTLLPLQTLLTIYKYFIRRHLDYGDVIYDQLLNESLSNRINSVQYKAASAIARTMQGSSREKLYQKLGLEHLHQRWWMTRLCLFYKVFHKNVPKYIHSLFSFMRTSSRQPNLFTSVYCRTEYFQNSFLPFVIKKWNKLDPDKRSCLSYNSFSKTLLKFNIPSEKFHNQIGKKLFTRLRLGFSHFHERKFRQNFEDILNSLYCCGTVVETKLDFFLRCQFFNDIRKILMNALMNTDRSLLLLSRDKLISFLLYGSDVMLLTTR